MAKPTKEQLKAMTILRNIRKNVINKKWECMTEGCTESAINSHLLQRHGILDNILEDHHMVEMRPIDIFKWNKDASPMTFKKVGLNEAISYPLFCNHHDTELFLDIENDNPNVTDYHSQLLFSYRCVCAEIRKKEIEIEFDKRQVNMQTLNFDSFPLNEAIKGLKRGVQDLESYKKLLLTELDSPKDNFCFNVIQLPFIPIYASACFSFEIDESKLVASTLPWDGAFIHILPRKHDTCVIIGAHQEHMNKELGKFIESFNYTDKLSVGILFTNLFSQRIENFGMSITLYNSLSQENINKFFDFQKKSIMEYNMLLEPGFNLFEGEYWDELFS